MITLFRKNAGGLGTWSIKAEGSDIVIAHATVLGGSEVVHREHVPKGLAGRTLDQQIEMRIRSRVSRMKDKGYKYSKEEASQSSSNQLGLLRPMLAQPLAKVTTIDYRDAVLQKKLDGHRCMITKQDDEIIAYSRQGKVIDTISHITDAMKDAIPEGVTVDGELYMHGQSLQTLASWIKREQPNTKLLNFVGYDLVSDESYKDRHSELSDTLTGLKTGHPGQIMVLNYEPYEGVDVKARLAAVRAAGFEGLMLRLARRGYEVGLRSSSLIKVKHFDDGEFKVLDIVPSADGWGICVCEAHNGKTFRTSAPGTVIDKTNALMNKARYIGRLLTVEYATLTQDGLPFHASAKRWREDI